MMYANSCSAINKYFLVYKKIKVNMIYDMI